MATRNRNKPKKAATARKRKPIAIDSDWQPGDNLEGLSSAPAQQIGPQPGSRDYVDPMGGVPDRYSVESIAERQAAAEAAGLAPSGVIVINDEWHGQATEGNPFRIAAQPYVDGNPDKEFRFLSPRNKRGRRGYQLVTDPKGKTVTAGGMELGWIPKTEAERRARANVEKSNRNIAAAREEFRSAAEKASADEPGVKGLRDGEIVGSMPIGIDARRGGLVSR